MSAFTFTDHTKLAIPLGKLIRLGTNDNITGTIAMHAANMTLSETNHTRIIRTHVNVPGGMHHRCVKRPRRLRRHWPAIA
jgi:hypothetical protein